MRLSLGVLLETENARSLHNLCVLGVSAVFITVRAINKAEIGET